MPISQRSLIVFLIASLFAQASEAASIPSGPQGPTQRGKRQEVGPMHWSGKKTLWNRKANTVELFGSAVVEQVGQTLRADYILLDLNKNTVTGKGNCYYQSAGSVIQSRELHFNLETGIGTIVAGRVSNGKFLLVGERINKLGDNKFQTHRAEYTTCVDCPGSWSFQGENVDLEFEKYAYMTNVTGKLKDVPFFWSPYLVIPVKTQRQTGFLFPSWRTSSKHGFQFVLPFFWAISRSVDMTVGLGRYTARGPRLEWEGRYALSERSEGQANVYYLQDTNASSPVKNRWALNVEQTQELVWGFEEKIKYVDTSDLNYPINFDDIEGRKEPVLTSTFIFSKSTSSLSSYLAAKRYRSLLNFDEPTEFDPNTVQLYPKFFATTNDQFIGQSPVAMGVDFGVSNFTRAATSFDHDPDRVGETEFLKGVDPVREATRINVTPKIYSTLRPWGVLSVIPSVEYNSYFYSFHEALPNLTRGYLHYKTDFSLQFEKIYDTDDPDYPRIKHLIRPRLTYSRIPYELNDLDHPFSKQLKVRSNYMFDTNDVIPYSRSPGLANYFVPQGNSIAYGVTTQLIRRKGEVSHFYPQYQRIVELDVNQALDITQLGLPEEDRPVPLSRLNSSLRLEFEKWNSVTEYNFYPYLGRILPLVLPQDRSPHEVSTRTSYVFEKAFHQNVLAFERSIGLGMTYRKLESKVFNMNGNLAYSLNDYILPRVEVSYSFLRHELSEIEGMLDFQSPSRCWKLTVTASHTVDRGNALGFQLALNLSGDGFEQKDSLMNQK